MKASSTQWHAPGGKLLQWHPGWFGLHRNQCTISQEVMAAVGWAAAGQVRVAARGDNRTHPVLSGRNHREAAAMAPR